MINIFKVFITKLSTVYILKYFNGYTFPGLESIQSVNLSELGPIVGLFLMENKLIPKLVKTMPILILCKQCTCKGDNK